MSQLELWTEQEEVQLQYHEQVIEKGLETFYEVGQSLMFIRENRLYRKEFKTFEEYCQEKWGRSRIWAHQMIKASEVVGVLDSVNNCEQKPQTESQARPLTKLETPEHQAEAWSNAVANSETGKPTAKEVDAEVKKLQEKIKQLEADKATLDRRISEQSTLIDSANQRIKEKGDLLTAANSKLTSEAERIAEEKAQKLKEEFEAKLQSLESDKAKAEEASKKAKSDYESALAKFKANPDPETQKAILDLKDQFERTKGEVDRVQHSLENLKQKEDQTFSVALSLERFHGAFQKLISNHPDAIVAMSSPYLDDRQVGGIELLAETLEDWAERIRHSVNLSRESNATAIRAVEVEVLEDGDDF